MSPPGGRRPSALRPRPGRSPPGSGGCAKRSAPPLAAKTIRHDWLAQPPSLLGGRKAKQHIIDSGVGRQQSCRSRRHGNGNGNGILDKIEAACSMVDYTSSSYGNQMEKATKWDYLNKKSSRRRVVALEAALEKQTSELEHVKRLATKKLRKVAEEKAWWKSKARCAAAALREELKMERRHRRQLEAANARLLKEVASARASAKQAAQRVETERKARELMEEACEELSKEVEEDQAEVEALRRECVAMREEMEEERRMLQMAEVWREERVQMKLSDARAVLDHKYAHLNALHAEMDGVTEGGSGSGRSRRSGNFNTALIRRLWRSAITESRRKTAAPASSSSGRNRVVHSPSYSDRDRDRDTARSSVIDLGSQGGGSAAAQEYDTRKKKKSLMEKLMEARMDDHRADKPQPA
ncbi:hypothetical protein E2562_004612 [Oryza meyeriana var. granulata]|uniref:Uncharacterized protein n=1 Tax=Oryza meyeriana var. granulata TaxID=110450 RepID=A0A6G1F3N5_9ORYZ|nr:hypothetical protein E2562_004612 [Oryza meyeriana var. granulata]